jgi:hypothetical protein
MIRTLSLLAFALLVVTSSARGQSLTANSVVTESEEDQLAREVDDPTAILTQLKFQDVYTPSNFFRRPRKPTEFRIDFGPGYRVYFGKDGERLVILLAGGTKKRQQYDIGGAIANWEDYKRRK